MDFKIKLFLSSCFFVNIIIFWKYFFTAWREWHGDDDKDDDDDNEDGAVNYLFIFFCFAFY